MANETTFPVTDPIEVPAKANPKERILAAAQDLFYRHGFHAVSVDAVAEAAGSNKMTLYSHFSSKDGLIMEFLRSMARSFDDAWDRFAYTYSGDPRGQLVAWYSNLGSFLVKEGGRGCALANAAIELAQKGHPIRQFIEERKIAQWEMAYSLCKAGDFIDPEGLADELYLLLEGARVSIQSVGVNGPAARLDALMRGIIDRHIRSTQEIRSEEARTGTGRGDRADGHLSNNGQNYRSIRPDNLRKGDDMTIESRLDALEVRVRVAEDHLELLNLLHSYGPAADSGSSHALAEAWTPEGIYDVGGIYRAEGRDAIASLFQSPEHNMLMRTGCAHLIAAPRIVVDGDSAQAVAYTFLVRRTETGFEVARTSTNHWIFARTQEGWRITERANRLLDGSEASRELLTRGVG